MSTHAKLVLLILIALVKTLLIGFDGAVGVCQTPPALNSTLVSGEGEKGKTKKVVLPKPLRPTLKLSRKEQEREKQKQAEGERQKSGER